jgi:lipooligosaccharide transport system permease protein
MNEAATTLAPGIARSNHWRLPELSTRAVQAWRRNFLVWRKHAIPSMTGHLADPMFYMLGLGFGLGALLPQVDGVRYINFLAGGTVCFSTMNSASFEALYSAFARMQMQRTWDAILNAPMTLDDVVFGEHLWAASKAFLSGTAILLVIWILGLTHSAMSLWIIPLTFLIGFCFAGMALVMTALSPSFDFFMFYMTLLMTPMSLVCGVFFPVEQLPGALQALAQVLPLTHAVELVRPLIYGAVPPQWLLRVVLLFAYGAIGFYVALGFMRKRLLQ